MMLATCSYAGVITFTQTGVGSGTVGTNTFTNAAFTITDTGDTANRVSFSGGYIIDATSASIVISGVGTLNFLIGTETFVSNTNQEVGFSRSSGSDLYDGPDNAAFGTWDLLTSIGPISGSAYLMQWTLSPVNTSGGVLVFSDGSSPTVFTATIQTAPEPSSLMLLGIGMAGIGMLTRQRRRRFGSAA
jgi:hypothetical protein